MGLEKCALHIHFLPVSGCSAEWNYTDFYFFLIVIWFSWVYEGGNMGWYDTKWWTILLYASRVFTRKRLSKFNKTIALFGIKKAICFSFHTWIVWKLNADSVKYVFFILGIIFMHLFPCRTSADTLVLFLDSVDEGLVFDS